MVYKCPEEEFAHCQDNEAYYITNKGQRKTAGGGELETSVIIETTSGYWREKKKDLPVYNGDDLIGHKTSYVFCSRENDETSWTMDALAVNPEIIPVAAKNQVDKIDLLKLWPNKIVIYALFFKKKKLYSV